MSIRSVVCEGVVDELSRSEKWNRLDEARRQVFAAVLFEEWLKVFIPQINAAIARERAAGATLEEIEVFVSETMESLTAGFSDGMAKLGHPFRVLSARIAPPP